MLGYIFEKYINQKQMGAYYTKEDITEYISKNTILPFLFDRAEKGCKVAFKPEGAVWALLRENPDHYIYPAVRHGVDLELPTEIAAGINDVSQRGGWNKSAAEGFALPTETWREHVARRKRCMELRQKLAAGEVTQINDLITYNLDIRQFAQDVITSCESSDLLKALYQAIEHVSVLDPTCGSGAFLFAALNILEPLYTACLERMQGFVDEVRKAIKQDGDQLKLDLQDDASRINEKAELADRAFQRFRQMQTEFGMDAGNFRTAKKELRRRLAELNDELNRYLAREYGVDVNKPAAFEKWRNSHQPFHWFVEFYSIIDRGGCR
ncbi:MAG: SAM-dependent DNA methyltransferase [Microcoleus sp. SIO2G3]|nr:SAM-dependent DNA methyltransferase [Microcoleus sp. SIO2G3]